MPLTTITGKRKLARSNGCNCENPSVYWITNALPPQLDMSSINRFADHNSVGAVHSVRERNQDINTGSCQHGARNTAKQSSPYTKCSQVYCECVFYLCYCFILNTTNYKVFIMIHKLEKVPMMSANSTGCTSGVRK